MRQSYRREEENYEQFARKMRRGEARNDKRAIELSEESENWRVMRCVRNDDEECCYVVRVGSGSRRRPRVERWEDGRRRMQGFLKVTRSYTFGSNLGEIRQRLRTVVAMIFDYGFTGLRFYGHGSY